MKLPWKYHNHKAQLSQGKEIRSEGCVTSKRKKKKKKKKKKNWTKNMNVINFAESVYI